MVEGEETGWMTVIEKKGLHQAAEILDKYGINSETDVSVIDRDHFCKLVSGWLKPSSVVVECLDRGGRGGMGEGVGRLVLV
jgi:hypothetical protein